VSRAQAPGKLTYQEFLQWCDEDTWAEWVDGDVVMVSPASSRHQDLVRFLVAVLSTVAETHDAGVVLPAPFQMKMTRSGREPDLLFVARQHLDRLKESHREGPADLVVEIVSPDSGARDRGEKFYEYEEAGVAEYWLVDPDRRRLECYELGHGGRYRLAFAGERGVHESRVLPGLWFRQTPYLNRPAGPSEQRES
jgi:Uma2 family endonuclease